MCRYSSSSILHLIETSMNSTLPQRFTVCIIKLLIYICVSYFHDLTCPLLMWEIKEKPNTQKIKTFQSPMPILLDIFPASYLYMALKSFPLWKHFQCVTHGIFGEAASFANASKFHSVTNSIYWSIVGRHRKPF